MLPKGSSIEAASFAPDKTPPPKNKAERWQELLGASPRACLVFADPSRGGWGGAAALSTRTSPTASWEAASPAAGGATMALGGALIITGGRDVRPGAERAPSASTASRRRAARPWAMCTR